MEPGTEPSSVVPGLRLSHSAAELYRSQLAFVSNHTSYLFRSLVTLGQLFSVLMGSEYLETSLSHNFSLSYYFKKEDEKDLELSLRKFSRKYTVKFSRVHHSSR